MGSAKQILITRRLLIEYAVVNKVLVRNASITYCKEPIEGHCSESDPRTQRLYAWGVAEHGGLGEPKVWSKHSRCRTTHSPVRKSITLNHKIVDIACGFGFSLIVTQNPGRSKLVGCGLNTDSQLGQVCARKDHPLQMIYSHVPIKVHLKYPRKTKLCKVAAGRAHSVLLTDAEDIFTWGNNAFGQCGRVAVQDEDYTLYRPMHNVRIPDENIVNVVCGQDHTLLLTETGRVYAFGCGSDGQTGLGHLKSTHVPTLVEGDIKGEKIVKLATSTDSVLALNDKGEVFGWGNSEYMQILNPEFIQQVHTPMHLKWLNKLGKIRDVASGSTWSIILTENRDVFVWGFGILGKGPNLSMSNIPEQIPNTLFGLNQYNPDVYVDSVHSGPNSLAAITNKGDLYTWGKNNNGELGVGHRKPQYFPFRVSVGAIVTNISIGVDHTMALCRPYI